MNALIVLFHYSNYQPLWEQPYLIQVGPNISNSRNGINIHSPSIQSLRRELDTRFLTNKYMIVITPGKLYTNEKVY